MAEIAVMEEAAGPRRYKVVFDCRAEQAGTLIALLIREVEQPKLDQTDHETYRITIICMMTQLPTIIGTIADQVVRLYVSPFVPEVKGPVPVYEARRPNSNFTPSSKITVLPPQRKRQNGVKVKFRDSGMGRCILRAFESGPSIKHRPDFEAVLNEDGYAMTGLGAAMTRLIAEGDLVRVGWGAYRMPTTQDALARMQGSTDNSSKDE